MRRQRIAIICGMVLGITLFHVKPSEAGANENKALVMKFVDAGNSRDYTRIDKIVSEHFVRHCQERRLNKFDSLAVY